VSCDIAKAALTIARKKTINFCFMA